MDFITQSVEAAEHLEHARKMVTKESTDLDNRSSTSSSSTSRTSTPPVATDMTLELFVGSDADFENRQTLQVGKLMGRWLDGSLAG